MSLHKATTKGFKVEQSFTGRRVSPVGVRVTISQFFGRNRKLLVESTCQDLSPDAPVSLRIGKIHVQIANDEISSVTWEVSPEVWRLSDSEDPIKAAMFEIQRDQDSNLLASIEAAEALEEVLRVQSSGAVGLPEAMEKVASAVVARFFFVSGAWPIETTHDREYEVKPLCDRYAELGDSAAVLALRALLRMTCLLLARDGNGALAYQSSVWTTETMIARDSLDETELGPSSVEWYTRLQRMLEVCEEERNGIFKQFGELVVRSPAQIDDKNYWTTAVVPDWSQTDHGPPTLLVSGAGPVGLMAAIYARRNGANVIVVEQRQQFTRIQVIEMSPSGMLQAIQEVGAEIFKDFRAKTTQFQIVQRISISNLQRLLSRLAVAVGVRVRFGREIIAYCPPEAAGPAVKKMMHARSRWYAVVYEHPDMTFDGVERSAWETYNRWKARTPGNTSYAAFVRWACAQAEEGGSYKAELFDATIAAEGTHSPLRDQGESLAGKGPWYEQYTRITFKEYAHGGTGLVTLANDALMNNQEELAYHHFAQAGEESAMYTSSILRPAGARRLEGKSSIELAAWLESPDCYLTSEPAGVEHGRLNGPFRLSYAANNQPLATKFAIHLHKASHSMVRQMSSSGVPMQLMVLGDALTTGYFPNGKGTNFPAQLVVVTVSRVLLDIGWKSFLGYYDTDTGKGELAQARERETQRRELRTKRSGAESDCVVGCGAVLKQLTGTSLPELSLAEKVFQKLFADQKSDGIPGTEEIIQYVNKCIMRDVERQAGMNGNRAAELLNAA